MKLLSERAEVAAWRMDEVLAEHNHAVGGFHMARERPKFSALRYARRRTLNVS